MENLNTSGISKGLHVLNIRFRPEGRKWSSVNSSFFFKENDVLVPINNLANYVYWYDNNWENPKSISIIGVQDISWNLNTNVSELSEGPHTLSMMFKDTPGKWSSIVTSNFNRGPITAPCLDGNRQFKAGIEFGANATFQWQVNEGIGFKNISNNTVYAGTNSETLEISNAPSTWSSYQYRCLVTFDGSTKTGPTYLLKFAMTWMGTVSTEWDNPANWSCNTLPNANMDIYINASAPRYPLVSTNISLHSLNLQPGATFEVLPGVNIIITGEK